MNRRASLSAMVLGLVLFTPTFVGCQPAVGDACEVQTDCGRTMYCERSLPGGYCTVRSCHITPCPEDSTCVEFDPDLSWCMALCDRDSDCRDGYRCVEDFAAVPFCNDDRGEPLATDDLAPGDASAGDAAAASDAGTAD
jgi:hypothetical protein